ncbi:K+-transporting ATPase ATPase C chain [Microlunatus flavus]|uniref:Potassium-transporting ATPase KdpC subunit n=1 Tax=Microlunatus flavus TaxID=1036181 RepID=A0A1H9DJ62_9ACTN|nr:potassium-transporting ATPase subunit C [Microlunatus flavus]SEQ13542.1 K+-transporting ATPase ATPase C chain [Microlunatus flavus]
MRSSWLSTHLAAVRALLVLTVLLGLVYPLAVLAVGRLPGLRERADGSLLHRPDGSVAGSSLVGQSFTDADGKPLLRYFQTRPSAAGDGYDPTATSASNLGPEDVVDTLPDPKAAPGSDEAEGRQSLLTQVCARSAEVGATEGVDGARPFCTRDGVGAVLVVVRTEGLTGPATTVVSVNQACPEQPFLATYEGVRVSCAIPGDDYSHGVVTPVRDAGRTSAAAPVVPSDAVTASGSGLDPDVSPAYAQLQVPRVARERGVDPDQVEQLVAAHTSGRALGFLGEPVVDVVTLNADLDTRFPRRG